MKIKSNISHVQRQTEALRRAVSSGNFRNVLARIKAELAEVGLNQLRLTTLQNIKQPRWKLSGMASAGMGGSSNLVERAWRIKPSDPQTIVWSNNNPIYRFLDQGTRAHGPRDATTLGYAIRRATGGGFGAQASAKPRAKMLFIPLKAAVARAYLKGELHLSSQGGIRRTRTVRRKGQRELTAATSNKSLVFGEDFVLAKRVRGITPRLISFQAVRKIDLAKRVIEFKAIEVLSDSLRDALRQPAGGTA